MKKSNLLAAALTTAVYSILASAQPVPAPKLPPDFASVTAATTTQTVTPATPCETSPVGTVATTPAYAMETTPTEAGGTIPVHAMETEETPPTTPPAIDWDTARNVIAHRSPGPETMAGNGGESDDNAEGAVFHPQARRALSPSSTPPFGPSNRPNTLPDTPSRQLGGMFGIFRIGGDTPERTAAAPGRAAPAPAARGVPIWVADMLRAAQASNTTAPILPATFPAPVLMPAIFPAPAARGALAAGSAQPRAAAPALVATAVLPNPFIMPDTFALPPAAAPALPAIWEALAAGSAQPGAAIADWALNLVAPRVTHAIPTIWGSSMRSGNPSSASAAHAAPSTPPRQVHADEGCKTAAGVKRRHGPDNEDPDKEDDAVPHVNRRARIFESLNLHNHASQGTRSAPN